MDQASLSIDGYTIVSKVGGGGFGEVFLGTENVTGREVAIKVERVGYREPQLRHEYKVYRELERRSIAHPPGFCRAMKFDGTERYNYMVMDLLGNSLSDLFRNTCSKRFTLKTVLQIADQILDRIEVFHSVNLIHRDISSGNFVMGRDDPDTIYFIDFGMSTRYRDPHTLEHNSERSAASRRGTTRYASINNLLGRQQSRRDDLESIAYILIRFLRRELPWEHISSTHYDKPHRVVRDMKINMPIDTLCEGLPEVFADFLRYARELQFAEDPDVPMWRARFRSLYEQHGYDREPFTWDWTNLPSRPKRGASVLTEPVAPHLLVNAPAGTIPALVAREAHRIEEEEEDKSVEPAGSPPPPPPPLPLVHAAPASPHQAPRSLPASVSIPSHLPIGTAQASRTPAPHAQTHSSSDATPLLHHPFGAHPAHMLQMDAQMQADSRPGSVVMKGDETSHYSHTGDTGAAAGTHSYSPSLAGTNTYSRSRDTLDTLYTPHCTSLAAASFESLGTVPDGDAGPYYPTLTLPSPVASPLRHKAKGEGARVTLGRSMKSLNSSFNSSTYSIPHYATEAATGTASVVDPNASTKTLPLADAPPDYESCTAAAAVKVSEGDDAARLVTSGKSDTTQIPQYQASY